MAGVGRTSAGWLWPQHQCSGTGRAQARVRGIFSGGFRQTVPEKHIKWVSPDGEKGIVGNYIHANVDVIEGSDFNDRLGADNYGDTIYGRKGDDTLYGGRGDDTLHGWGGDDTLHGGRGDDTLKGYEGDDTLDGWKGDDTLDGGFGHDRIFGGNGDDTLRGGDETMNRRGDDILDGGAGDDTLTAGRYGDDTLVGGAGDDVLVGDELGEAIHTFVFNASDGVQTDTIRFFEQGWEAMDLDNDIIRFVGFGEDIDSIDDLDITVTPDVFFGKPTNYWGTAHIRVGDTHFEFIA